MRLLGKVGNEFFEGKKGSDGRGKIEVSKGLAACGVLELSLIEEQSVKAKSAYSNTTVDRNVTEQGFLVSHGECG